jgi:phosphoglycolate phosphatase-like HAD superfamily hydrolase
MPHRHPLAPVVAIDIDGTIAQYHSHFLNFARLWSGRDLDMNWEGACGSFSKAIGMSKKSYRECKLAYRQGGMKRSLPVFEGARDLTVNIRKAGAQVWICTTRPYLRLDNIDPDTRHFLRRNGIQHDGFLYGERKYQDLVKIVGDERVLVVLDDLPEQIEAANRLGLKTILRYGAHNAWYIEQPHCKDQEVTMTLGNVESRILSLIDERKNGK